MVRIEVQQESIMIDQPASVRVFDGDQLVAEIVATINLK